MSFKNFLWFDIIEGKGAKIMNTDKIYAERLASEYAPKTTRKIKALIRLDKWIKKPAFFTALTVGTLSALVFLLGLILVVLIQFLVGFIFIGIGIVGMCISPFIYNVIFTKRKRDNATDVLLLAQEILEEN